MSNSLYNNNAHNHPFRYHPSTHSSLPFSSSLCFQTQTWPVFLHRSGCHGDGASQARFAPRTMHTGRCKQAFSSSFFAHYCVASSGERRREKFARRRSWRGDGAGSVTGHWPRICKLLWLQLSISTGHCFGFWILLHVSLVKCRFNCVEKFCSEWISVIWLIVNSMFVYFRSWRIGLYLFEFLSLKESVSSSDSLNFGILMLLNVFLVELSV